MSLVASLKRALFNGALNGPRMPCVFLTRVDPPNPLPETPPR